MAPTNVGYSLKEALSHFFRNWTTSLGAVITIFLSLFIIGLFVMGSAMLNSVIGTVEDQVVINAFISDDAQETDVQAFKKELEGWSNVKSVTYKDKDAALAEYTSKMSSNADATMSALDGQNPLPASFAIEMDDPSKVASTAEKLKKSSDFQKIVDDGDVNASVLYGQEEVSRLFQVTNYIRIAAVVLVGLLTFIAFIFINNTIRLSITALSVARLSPRACCRPFWALRLPSVCSSSCATCWFRASRRASVGCRSRCRSSTIWSRTLPWCWSAC